MKDGNDLHMQFDCGSAGLKGPQKLGQNKAVR